MNLLFRIIYAAHCNGTHHKIAIDSLRYLKDDNAVLWRNLFLNHVEAYIEGSKAPDKTFKDFKNHVLHVRDGFWGGAADKSEEWYNRLVHNLTLKNWKEAAYCAGVLSHYYADALHPFHTAQSEAESSVHRAVEWSISKSYDQLRLDGIEKWPTLVVEMPTGEGWVKTLVQNNASFSNQYYETLITHYDFHKGVIDPLEGFDDHANEVISKILRFSAISFSHVLDRAFAQSGVKPIKTGLTIKSFLASLKTPLFWLTRKMSDHKERKLVEAIYDELQATGTVEKNLSVDDRTIKKKYEAQVLAKQSYHKAQKQSQTLFASKSERRAQKRKQKEKDHKKMTFHPGKTNMKKLKSELNKILPSHQAINHATLSSDASNTLTSLNSANSQTLNEKTPNTTHQYDRQSEPAKAQYFLAINDPVADGPFVGDKTAKRLEKIGIFSVSDFIHADAAHIAKSINMRNTDSTVIMNWQNHATLMCHIPNLKVQHAKLLVSSGIESPSQLAATNQDDLSRLIYDLSLTEEGQKILRNKALPSSESIANWIITASDYLATKVAA